MTDRSIFHLVHAEARRRAVATVECAPDGYRVTVEEPRRSLDQNAALWPILQAFSEQKTWSVNGKTEKLDPAEWKDVLSASFQGEQMRMAPMIGGRGVVMLGLRTSKMGKRRFSEFLDYIHSVAAEMGVQIEVTA
jgi:hypothetical protein